MPFGTFWIFTRKEWGPDGHMRFRKKHSERPMNFRDAVSGLLQRNAQHFELQGMSGVQLTICAASRSNQNGLNLWEFKLVGLAPQALPLNFVVRFSIHFNIWVQHFNAVHAPLKHSEYLQGKNGEQLAICAFAKSIQNGWKISEMQWVPYFNAMLAPLNYKEWVGSSWPYAQLQEAIRTA